MVSKRSSEWSVKSRSSLTWIDTPKTVEEEHGGPWYTVRYDNPPMALNPLGNQSLRPNSRTNDTADPMILLERCAFRSLARRGESYHPRVEARPRGRWYAAPKKEAAPKKKVVTNGTSRRRKQERRTMPIAPTEAKSIDRSQAPIEANCADRSQLVDRSHLHRNHCVAPSEANRAERSRPR